MEVVGGRCAGTYPADGGPRATVSLHPPLVGLWEPRLRRSHMSGAGVRQVPVRLFAPRSLLTFTPGLVPAPPHPALLANLDLDQH
ncbi:hypothetical protein J6590_042345 [Homalodisca vitripennis]|nr:hypothetical protein J6590_042345 [Homalodisca vitripennis]